MTRFTVKGPYHYDHDMHPCFRIDAPDRHVASVFFVDGNEESGESEAVLLANTLNKEHAGTLAAYGASEYACYRWPEDSGEHRAMRAAYCEGAAHAVSALKTAEGKPE